MSMPCPQCGAKAACTDSRPRPNGQTHRSYRCLKKKCAARWTTREIVTPVLANLANLERGRGPFPVVVTCKPLRITLRGNITLQ